MIIKKVEITSTDNNIFRLKGYDCKNNLQKVDLIDNQQVKVCDESKFSSYNKALESKFTILHKKTFKTILVNTCKVKLTTLEGYCRPNSITWKLGAEGYYSSGLDSGLTALRTIKVETFP